VGGLLTRLRVDCLAVALHWTLQTSTCPQLRIMPSVAGGIEFPPSLWLPGTTFVVLRAQFA
jgi:hypothetical protein